MALRLRLPAGAPARRWWRAQGAAPGPPPIWPGPRRGPAGGRKALLTGAPADMAGAPARRWWRAQGTADRGLAGRCWPARGAVGRRRPRMSLASRSAWPATGIWN